MLWIWGKKDFFLAKYDKLYDFYLAISQPLLRANGFINKPLLRVYFIWVIRVNPGVVQIRFECVRQVPLVTRFKATSAESTGFRF